MTWGGLQGFQTPIEPETFTVDGFGVFGNMHQERNLTCKRHFRYIYELPLIRTSDVEFYYSGHMTPRKSSFTYSWS